MGPRGAPGRRRPAALGVDYGVIVAYLGVLVVNLVMLFAGARRPLYDRIAGTVVLARTPGEER